MESFNFSQNTGETVKPTAVLLIGMVADNSLADVCRVSLDELRALVETALEDEPLPPRCFYLTQCKRSPESATYIGSGKVKEAADLCKGEEVSLVVCDDELTPSQIRNLENAFDPDGSLSLRVIDRTMLILDIFAAHAVTGEGKLQVEIAQLKYTSPRLTGKGVSLSRQGGTSGVIGARGPGETKLETDKRHLASRIQSLKEELAVMTKERAVKRSKRLKSGIPSAAVVGYTNAGKSTLLNRLTDAGILAADKLFATLDPTVRKLTLPSGSEILLTDTVGFISRLPHGLIEAFRSTLDEVRYADLLLIVIDASDPQIEEKTRVTRELLSSLEAADKPTVFVFNKCDALAEPLKLPTDPDTVYVCLSALTGEGTQELLEAIDDMLAKSKRRVTFLIPFDKTSAVNHLYKNAVVESVDYLASGTKVTAFVSQKEIGQFGEWILEEESK